METIDGYKPIRRWFVIARSIPVIPIADHCRTGVGPINNSVVNSGKYSGNRKIRIGIGPARAVFNMTAGRRSCWNTETDGAIVNAPGRRTRLRPTRSGVSVVAASLTLIALGSVSGYVELSLLGVVGLVVVAIGFVLVASIRLWIIHCVHAA